jgi:hypothetical protein
MEDSASEASTGSATSLRIRSWVTALLSRGWPTTTRRVQNNRRPGPVSGWVACSVASTSPVASAVRRSTGAKRPPPSTWAASG